MQAFQEQFSQQLQKVFNDPDNWDHRENLIRTVLLHAMSGPLELPFVPTYDDVFSGPYWMYSRHLWEPASWLFREYLQCADSSSNPRRECFRQATKVVIGGRADA